MNLLCFMIGASIGSFFMTAAERGDASVLFGRSHCICGKTLQAWELIPVAGYILQGGKTHCGAKIPPIYPVVETCVGLGTLFLLRSGRALETLFFLSLLFSACEDIVRHEIHVWGLIPAFLIACYAALIHRIFLPTPVVILFFAILSYMGGIGEGDIYVAGVMALFLGPNTLAAMLLAFLIGGAFALVLILRGADRKAEIPMVPFLLLGYVASFWVRWI